MGKKIDKKGPEELPGPGNYEQKSLIQEGRDQRGIQEQEKEEKPTRAYRSQYHGDWLSGAGSHPQQPYKVKS